MRITKAVNIFTRIKVDLILVPYLIGRFCSTDIQKYNTHVNLRLCHSDKLIDTNLFHIAVF